MTLSKFAQCWVPRESEIRVMGFKRAQGNQHCTKFESHTNRVTFETNAIRMTSSIQALNIATRLCWEKILFLLGWYLLSINFCCNFEFWVG